MYGNITNKQTFIKVKSSIDCVDCLSIQIDVQDGHNKTNNHQSNMFGIIQDCLEDFVIKLYGEDRWLEILNEAGINLKGASFLMHKNYDDRITYKIITTASKVLKLNIDTVLEAMGSHFIGFVNFHGYEKMLQSLGNNLHDFLANLDYMHEHLSHVFVGMRAPSFRVTHSTDGTMQLLYHSERKGMAPLVRGLVMMVATHFFKTEVIVNQLNRSDETPIIFEVINKSVDPDSDAFEKIKTPFTDSNLSASPKNLFLSVETLNEALPFHFVFKRNFRIIEMGLSLRRFVPKDIRNGALAKDKKIMFSDMFIVAKPIIELTFETFLTFSNHLFLLQTRVPYTRKSSENANDSKNKTYTLEQEVEQSIRLTLKGAMISLPAFDAMLFLGSPKVEDTDEMEALDLTMTDFPILDPTGRHILTRATRVLDHDIIAKINQAANHLKIVEKKLRLEISKNHKILNEIFPPKIARILCQSIKVDAEHFESCTCLYSDIVNFTAMCSSGKMKAIDIVRLLNKLYIQFDNQTNYYGTFKVETVGDAYIVISGVPEPVEDHADRVVEMGLAMVHVTKTIFSPVDGKHIEMRIGIHSGSCMAGIVGLSMPRYAVFGRTIALANKMEFAGPHGMVHISEATKKALKKDKYYFADANVQHLFEFPTYIVTKLYEEYHEDNLIVENNLNMSGGLFKSPNSSPTHQASKQAAARVAQVAKADSTVNNKAAPKNRVLMYGRHHAGPNVPTIRVSNENNERVDTNQTNNRDAALRDR